jgi:cytochrome bd-type quinol oxidase subunit 2
MPEKPVMVYVFMAILGIMLIAAYIYIGTKVGNRDTNNELSKNVTIIAVITIICVSIWTFLIYMYFSADTSIAIPYLFISQGFIMFFSLTALGVSSIQSSNFVPLKT